MRYFTYIAEQSFKTAPTGERLFFQSGPWSRPYILPNAETEQRIFWKLVWQLRIMLGAMIIGMPFLVLWAPDILKNPLYFVGATAAITALFVLTGKLVMAPDLKNLDRTQEKLSANNFYGEMARKHSMRGLLLGLTACLAFVIASLWAASRGQLGTIGYMCAAFFAVCSLAWGYAVWLKRGPSEGTPRA
jgi:hypothetical protein